MKAPPSTLAEPSRILRDLLSHRMACLGLIYLSSIGILCLLAPWISPHDYQTQNLALGPTPPSSTHWLGTDLLGRDLFSRILHGGRVSFAVGFLATAVAITVGVLYGMTSGLVGGVTDRIMMRLVEILYSLPFVIFVILLVTLFGRHLILIFLAIGAVEWLTMARIIRGEVSALRVLPFVEAGRALGRSRWGLMRHHLLPNLVGTILVYGTLTVPTVMLLEAFISFLGLGVQAPQTSWGDLIKTGAESMEEYPWLLIFPSLAFGLTLFSLNFIGDGLRSAWDPWRQNGRSESDTLTECKTQ